MDEQSDQLIEILNTIQEQSTQLHKLQRYIAKLTSEYSDGQIKLLQNEAEYDVMQYSEKSSTQKDLREKRELIDNLKIKSHIDLHCIHIKQTKFNKDSACLHDSTRSMLGTMTLILSEDHKDALKAQSAHTSNKKNNYFGFGNPYAVEEIHH